MRKKPITNGELFHTLLEILKEKNLLPDILDYSLAESRAYEIKTYEFNWVESLKFGGNEGIYLNFGIRLEEDGQMKTVPLGTFKTLLESREAFLTMSTLLGNFLFEGDKYVNSHLDDFTWSGFDIHSYDKEGEKSNWGYECGTPDSAVKRISKLFEKYDKVCVRNNETRQEQDIEKSNWENTLHW